MHKLSQKGFDELRRTGNRSKVQELHNGGNCRWRSAYERGGTKKNVHDLDLFVTVQILDAPAVLSLGKLCEEHGCSYEWASGQKPHLTPNGKIILWKTQHFVPDVFPELS